MIRLTSRDLKIMLCLARNGFATIQQIQYKWFNSYDSCIKRLRKLRENKYLQVIYIERYGSGIYSLTKQGLDFINDYYGCSYKNYARSNKINHYISCSELYLNFPYTIIKYEMEYYLDDIIPDIYIKYENKKEVDLLIEIDNTNKLNIIKQKINNYNKYYDSFQWKEHFDLFPKVLIASNVNCKNIRSNVPINFVKFNNIKELKL